MPVGRKGFLPGRLKTGGRKKGSVNLARRSSKFIERLKGYGFNYDNELADVLKALKNLRNFTSDDPKKAGEQLKRATELKFYYNELKLLLPYMTPKLREKEVELVDEPQPQSPESTISDEDLLNALDGKQKTKDDQSAGNRASLEARSSELQTPSRSDEDLSDLVGEQTENE